MPSSPLGPRLSSSRVLGAICHGPTSAPQSQPGPSTWGLAGRAAWRVGLRLSAPAAITHTQPVLASTARLCGAAALSTRCRGRCGAVQCGAEVPLPRLSWGCIHPRAAFASSSGTGSMCWGLGTQGSASTLCTPGGCSRDLGALQQSPVLTWGAAASCLARSWATHEGQQAGPHQGEAVGVAWLKGLWPASHRRGLCAGTMGQTCLSRWGAGQWMLMEQLPLPGNRGCSCRAVAGNEATLRFLSSASSWGGLHCL